MAAQLRGSGGGPRCQDGHQGHAACIRSRACGASGNMGKAGDQDARGVTTGGVAEVSERRVLVVPEELIVSAGADVPGPTSRPGRL